MNPHQPNRPLKLRILFPLAALLLAVFATAWYHPKIFTFHAKLSSPIPGVSGEVFQSSDGTFFVRIDSGSQLTVRQNPPHAFLFPSSKPTGFRIGRFLILPAHALGGIDLSHNEGFDHIVPTIANGKITLRDPMQQKGLFSFPCARNP